MKNVVITIGREYGSGGKYIGSKVAKRLNIPFYDKELINKTYEKNGCNYSKLEHYDENKRNKFLKSLEVFNIYNPQGPFDYEIYHEMMSSTIKDLADAESCIILGRNSNQILKGKDNVINIFIYSNNLDFKIKRKMEIENMDYNSTLKKLKYVDKQRKKYYESLNKNTTWGNKNDYDFLIDSSLLGIDKTIDLIVDIYNKFKEK